MSGSPTTIHLPVVHQRAPREEASQRAAIARDLAREVAGEVRLGRHDRMLYATDASIYQVEPIGVVVPGSIDDAARVVRFCHDRGLPILPRGGGTSLAGQAVNHALVIDFSAYCHRILDVDAEQRVARVEPGVVLEHLNQSLQPKGLIFGPDVATASHANLGGMIGNNSAGAHSVRYGRTSEHLRGLDVILADGTRLTLEEGASERDAAMRRLTRRVMSVIEPIASEIDARFPKTTRRVGGYNLDLLLQQARASTRGTYDRVNLAHLFCGSEGTLGVTLGATLDLVSAPKVKGLAILAFENVDAALEAVAPLLETNPAAVELVDDFLIRLAIANIECRRYVDLIPGGLANPPGAVLYVEHFADSAEQRDQRFADLARLFPTAPMRTITDPMEMARAWKLRASGEPLLYGLPGKRKPLTFIEDAAVPTEYLPAFIRRFRAIIESHGTTAAYYAHASVGVLHVRPLINPRDPHDLDAMQSIAREVNDLVMEYGGAISGEHGDGRLRSHLIERFYGPVITEAFRRIKRIFDPENRMNPGNIVSPGAEPPPAMTEHLRVRPGEAFIDVPPVQTYFRYERECGFASAIEMCNGAGVCRKTRGGTMCPSYRVTRDERHATRGRGNALRLAITGQLDSGRAPMWNDTDTLATLDLCLSCKACKTECPSNVDVARLKAEYLAQSFDAAGGAPLSTRIFGRVRAINRLGSIAPGLVNRLNRLGPVRGLINRMTGIDPRRSLPPMDRSLYRWFHRRATRETDAPAVVLYPDCFTVYNEPSIGRAAVGVLESLGYRVILPHLGCCGRAMISTGLLPQAIETIEHTASDLGELLEREKPVAILFAEPSCLSAVTDDWPDLRVPIDRVLIRRIAERSMLIEDFVEERWDSHPSLPSAPGSRARGAKRGEPHAALKGDGQVLVHGHCHQKALWGMERTERLLCRLCGDRVHVLETGCCGMAGAFGFTADHYDLSMRVAEESLLPQLQSHPDATVLACGTSCRHQILDAAGRVARHPIEFIAAAIQSGAEPDPRSTARGD